MLDDDIVKAAEQLLAICKRKNLLVATAESCTAGLIAGTLSEVPGVSSILDRGYITYSNEAKHEMLGVPVALIADRGAVSEAVAMAMAEGARSRSGAQCALSVTGVAGPGGGSAAKPVGMVCFGFVADGAPDRVVTRHFAGDRAGVRAQSVVAALQGLLDLIGASRPP